MPTIKNPVLLTITPIATNGTAWRIKITYSVEFGALERNLIQLGLVFQEKIVALGVDPGQADLPLNNISFPSAILAPTPLPPGTFTTQPETIPRTVIKDVPRGHLEEDPLGVPDEIRCRIRIVAIGLPPAVTQDVFTNQVTVN